jgi:hypothetical protein
MYCVQLFTGIQLKYIIEGVSKIQVPREAKPREIDLVEVDQNLANYINGILWLFYYTEAELTINLSWMFVYIISSCSGCDMTAFNF